MWKKAEIYIFKILVIIQVYCACSYKEKYTNWEVTGGSKENIRYSALTQIDTANVHQLKIAWIYNSEGGDSLNFGPMQCNPIIVNKVLYGVSPKLKLFAVDAITGKEIWQFDAADSINNKTWHLESVNMNRGVAYWEEGEDKRIIFTIQVLKLIKIY